MATVLSCEHLQRVQAVFCYDEMVVFCKFRLVDNGVCTALFQCSFGKLVAVEVGSLQGKEDRTLWTVSAVGGHHRVLCEDVIQLFDAHSGK